MGEVGIGPGIGPQDVMSRVVIDSGNNILFAYSLEASRGKSLDTVSIRVGPISPAMEADILRRAKAARPPRFADAHLPTMAAVRELPPVKIGEAVTLDILYKPTTGEKIYDVFRPITRLTISLTHRGQCERNDNNGAAFVYDRRRGARRYSGSRRLCRSDLRPQEYP